MNSKVTLAGSVDYLNSFVSLHIFEFDLPGRILVRMLLPQPRTAWKNKCTYIQVVCFHHSYNILIKYRLSFNSSPLQFNSPYLVIVKNSFGGQIVEFTEEAA